MSIFSSWFSRNSGAKAKPSVIDDAAQSAAWIAKALSSSGYRADFTLESLRDIDRFFDEHTSGGRARQGGLLAQNLGHRLFALGAYCGEVIRRVAGGTWSGGTEGPEAEIELALVLPNGTTLYPVQRAMKRYQNGTEDSLYAYASVMVQQS
jgi:hypothetical protein